MWSSKVPASAVCAAQNGSVLNARDFSSSKGNKGNIMDRTNEAAAGGSDPGFVRIRVSA
jgi:hypothetical protein